MVLGGPWESLRAPWERFGRRERTNKIWGAHFVGSRDSFRSVKKWLEIVYFGFFKPNSDISKVLIMPTLRV